ncbi:hypothetical protein ABFV57_33370, partial [Pseudomonas neuropathica]
FTGRQKLNELTRIQGDANAYLKALDTMKERLSLSTWLKGLVAEPSTTPSVLGSHSLSASGELNALCEALHGIESLSEQTPVVS